MRTGRPSGVLIANSYVPHSRWRNMPPGRMIRFSTLYVLRGELLVMTRKFGCGLAQCGACSVLLGDEEVRACIAPVCALEGKEVTTVEGLPARWANELPATAKDALQPVQEARLGTTLVAAGKLRASRRPWPARTRSSSASIMSTARASRRFSPWLRDEGAITSQARSSYPILTMAQMPELRVVIAPAAKAEVYGQGSEIANAVAAIAAAFFDTTGKHARRIPLRPKYLKAMLTA